LKRFSAFAARQLLIHSSHSSIPSINPAVVVVVVVAKAVATQREN